MDFMVHWEEGMRDGSTDRLGPRGKETLEELNDKEQLKQIDICAFGPQNFLSSGLVFGPCWASTSSTLRLGPLRVTSALYKGGLLKGGKASVIKHAWEIMELKGYLYVETNQRTNREFLR